MVHTEEFDEREQVSPSVKKRTKAHRDSASKNQSKKKNEEKDDDHSLSFMHIKAPSSKREDD